MRYSSITDAYAEIEATNKRLDMTNYLVELIKEKPKELIGKVAYLTQGALYPDFEGVEFGMAEKMVTTALANATGIKKEEIVDMWKDTGAIEELYISSPYLNIIISIKSRERYY